MKRVSYILGPTASRRVANSLRAQRANWFEGCCSARGQESGDETCASQYKSSDQQNVRGVGFDGKQLSGHSASCQDGGGNANGQADRDLKECSAQDESQDIHAVRAEGHPD